MLLCCNLSITESSCASYRIGGGGWLAGGWWIYRTKYDATPASSSDSGSREAICQSHLHSWNYNTGEQELLLLRRIATRSRSDSELPKRNIQLKSSLYTLCPGCLTVCLSVYSAVVVVLFCSLTIESDPTDRIESKIHCYCLSSSSSPDQTRTWPIQKVLRCEIHIYVLGPFREPENRLPGRERELSNLINNS